MAEGDQSPIEVGAYFYPLTKKDPIRQKRAKKLGRKIADEPKLAQKAKPLFPGHEQPHTYSLGSPERTIWDDSELESMGPQIELAKQYGLGFFVFDTYIGTRGGKPVQEAGAPLDEAFLKLEEARNMKFALMLSFKGPRAVLPTPKGFVEPGREIDFSVDSAREIVDQCMEKYWTQPNYLTVMGRPYLSIFTSSFVEKDPTGKFMDQTLRTFLEELNVYADKKYQVDPYIVGILRKFSPEQSIAEATQESARIGMDALTGYAILPEFGKGAPAVQVYDQLVVAREQEWFEVGQESPIPFVPPAVVGWDASPRAVYEQIQSGDFHSINEFAGYYPHTPIVIGSTPDKFAHMTRKTLNFVSKHVPKDQQLGIVCAWNEITEGMALLPRVREGEVDMGYLEALKGVIDEYSKIDK